MPDSKLREVESYIVSNYERLVAVAVRQVWLSKGAAGNRGAVSDFESPEELVHLMYMRIKDRDALDWNQDKQSAFQYCLDHLREPARNERKRYSRMKGKRLDVSKDAAATGEVYTFEPRPTDQSTLIDDFRQQIEASSDDLFRVLQLMEQGIKTIPELAESSGFSYSKTKDLRAEIHRLANEYNEGRSVEPIARFRNKGPKNVK